MKNKDLISVVVPCYNTLKYIDRCLDSLINQTYDNIEILVIDDGSKDNLKEHISGKYNDERIKYFYKENGGLSSARNYGLDRIKGKYVTFVDSDDYVDINYIEKLYNSIILNKSDISVCGFKRVYPKKTTLNKVTPEIIDGCIYPAAWNKMYKSELFKDVRYPIGKWYEDLGTTPKLTMTCKCSIVDECLYYYIQNSTSIMHTYNSKINDIYDIEENLVNYLKDNNKLDEEHDKIEFINIYHILIGTVFRLSFMKKFKIKDIKKVYKYVSTKYPKWYKNKYIKKNLSFAMKGYLFALRLHLYFIVYILLKLFNKRLGL